MCVSAIIAVRGIATMTAIIAYVLPGDQHAALWTDGAGTDPDGTIAAACQKTLLIAYLPAAIAIRGMSWVAELATRELFDAFTDFDDLVARFDAAWGEAEVGLPDVGAERGDYQIVMAGYSASRARAEIHVFCSAGTGGLPQRRLTRVPAIAMPLDADVAATAAKSGFKVGEMAFTDDAALVLIRAQRQVPGVGLFAMRTEIRATGLISRIVERWSDDYVGKRSAAWNTYTPPRAAVP
jgi:hypothetical protein